MKKERSLADPSRPWSIPPEAIEEMRARARARPPVPPEVRKKFIALLLAQEASNAAFPLTEALMVQHLDTTMPLRTVWVAPLALEAATKRLPRQPEVAGPVRDLLREGAWMLRLSASVAEVAAYLNAHLTEMAFGDKAPNAVRRAAEVLELCVALLDACVLDSDVPCAVYATALGADDLVVDLLLLGCSQSDAVSRARKTGAPTPNLPPSSLRSTVPPLISLDHWDLWEGNFNADEW